MSRASIPACPSLPAADPKTGKIAGTFMQNIAKKLTRSVWSMRTDRELIALSKTKTLEALVDHFKHPPTAILTKAKRLGLSIKRKAE
jgi:hypothetical protein